MVCLGNICRSPLAEGILKKKTEHLKVIVDSAGTASYHTGSSPDKRSIAIGEKYNIDIQNQRARQFSISDFDSFDKIYAMDTDNYTNIISLARNEKDKEKVDVILNELNPGKFDSVPDPYYGGVNGFEDVYVLLDQACEKIKSKITQ